MAVQVGDALTTPRDPFGRLLVPDHVDGPKSAVLRRLANEFVLLDFVARNSAPKSSGWGAVPSRVPCRAPTDELERWTEQARAQAEQARVDAEAAKTDAHLARVETEAAVVRPRSFAARRLASARSSTGPQDRPRSCSVARSSKRPGIPVAHRLPLDLVRLWRRRGLSADHRDPGLCRASSHRTDPAPPEPVGSQPGMVIVGGWTRHAGMSRTWPSRCGHASARSSPASSRTRPPMRWPTTRW